VIKGFLNSDEDVALQNLTPFLCRLHLAITVVIDSVVHAAHVANSQDHEPVALVQGESNQ